MSLLMERVRGLVEAGERISSADALLLFQERGNTAELLELARVVRQRKHGNRTYYVHSLNINPSNVCENKCDLCAFWREKDDADSYMMTLEQARAELAKASDLELTDLHIVGGIIPELNLAYYEDLFRLCREMLPDVLVQGLTAVEVAYLAKCEGMAVRDVLERLKKAGLGAIPGGGAEIFDEAVRKVICRDKIGADEWLDVHEAAHGLGIPTNVTMLFGHIEKPAHIVDHMQRIRDLQDRTGGFEAFIGLPFHPMGTKLGVDRGPSGHEIAKVIALARIYLDNVPHMRLLVNYLDRKLLQVLAATAVDDIGGTSLDERIAKAAGSSEECRFYSSEEMEKFLRAVGLDPLLVDSAYKPKGRSTAEVISDVEAKVGIDELRSSIERGERIGADQALMAYREISFSELGRLADLRRREAVGGDDVTYVVDRNISLTNVCESACDFCAFYVDSGSDRAFTLSKEEVLDKVIEAVDFGATQIMVQGGLNPELGLSFYESLFRLIKKNADVWIHSLTPTEIHYLSKLEGITYSEVLKRLVDAGLDSLPGGGAEILVDRMRNMISPRKVTAGQWLDVMETAQGMGLLTTATMVYGLGETDEERVEHLMKIRDLQDRTGGFSAFIPWSFQPGRTRIEIEPATGVDYLKIVALARLVLDNVKHVQAGWVTEGPALAQLALSFGADDFGGVLMEEQVVRAAGTSYSIDRSTVISLIEAMGRNPVERKTDYTHL